jgi:hypothetical protein
LLRSKKRPGPLMALTPAQTRDVYYAYDNRDLKTGAWFDAVGGEGIATGYDSVGRSFTFGYDALGNRRYEFGPQGVVAYDYEHGRAAHTADLAGRLLRHLRLSLHRRDGGGEGGRSRQHRHFRL